MKPSISVVIPALNEEKFLPHLLDSLVSQTVRGFEVIVVDGISQDKTVKIANSYKKKIPGLNVIISSKASLPLQRNLGAKNSSGEIIIFVDADSILMSNFIERVNQYILKFKPELMTTWFRPDSESNNDAVLTLIANITLEASIMLKKPFSPGPLTIVTRKSFNLVGGYDEEHAFNEDVDFGFRLHKTGVDLAILRETLYVWSMRRMRQQGTMKVLQQYAKAALPILFFNKTMKNMSGYIMGGQMYLEKNPQKLSLVKEYEAKFKKLMNELAGK